MDDIESMTSPSYIIHFVNKFFIIPKYENTIFQKCINC